MDTEAIRRFVSLENRKKELDAALKEVTEHLGDAKEAAIEALVAEGLDAVEVDGRRVALIPKASASPLTDRESLVAALKTSTASGLVSENYNTNSLNSFATEVYDHVRQQAKDEKWDRLCTEDDVRDAMPEPLRDAVKIFFYYTLSSTKSKSN